MKSIILIIMFMPSLVFAHCPIGINIDGQELCANLEWQVADQKVQGQLVSTNQQSPQLIMMGEIPQKWFYSKAILKFWRSGDPESQSLVIKNLRVFPYMHMENGHHHSTAYEFNWNYDSKFYEIKSMTLQEMAGCWSLRWTTEDVDQKSTSQFLVNILNYKNLNDEENKAMLNYCENVQEGGNQAQGHHH